MLVVFSDGGTDHCMNLYSVKLSFLWVMMELDLDEVVCLRTAPGDSWVNPAERRMADLNIAWEGASFARKLSSQCEQLPLYHARWFEKSMKSVSNMNSIRKLVTHEDAISNSMDIPGILKASVQPVISAMRGAVSKINGTANEPWTILPAAAEKDCTSVMNFLKAEICSQLDVDKMQASVVEGTTAETILQAHKIENNRYMFQMRKRLVSGDDTTCIPQSPLCSKTSRLPSSLSQTLSPSRSR